MKKISTNGIYFLEKFIGTEKWYFGMEYTDGDLYEAEELYNDKHKIDKNRLILVSYPDGKVYEPIIPDKWQYFGRPFFYDGKIIILLIDFSLHEIYIKEFDDKTETVKTIVTLPLSITKDCYNLMLKGSPLMLTRQGSDDTFQIFWPDKADFEITGRESFSHRDGKKLYFETWHEEDVEYYEEIIVRDIKTGEILEKIPGSIMDLPNGEKWILN